jgi:galacturan 1,4-alpha-galacturonidase
MTDESNIGLGNTYWQAMVSDSTVFRPILLGTDGLHNSSITDLTMRNPPNWFNIIANSTDILVSNMTLSVVVASSSAPAKVRARA